MRSSETSEGKLICLNAKTGETEWVHSRKTNARAENLHSYASLTVWPDKGQDLLLVHGADYLTAHRAMDGKEVWRMGDLNGSGGKYNNALRFVSSPGIGGGRVIVPSAKNGPMVCLDPKQAKGNVSIDDDAVVWRLSKGTPDVATPVVYRDVVYVVTKKGLLAAHDLTDGRSLYRERLVADKHRSTPIVSDGKIFVVGRDGVVAIVKAGEKFKVLAKCELKEEATSSPAVADGVLYIRTWKAIYAFRKAPDD
jgi:outer membrane protein assembly factor BamB